jgi:hypothetical protein
MGAFTLPSLEEMTMLSLFHPGADRSARLLPVCVLIGLFCPGPAAAEDAATEVTGKRLSILRGQEDVIVREGDQLLLRYRYRGVPKKPYVAEMTSPGGVNILLDAPADHLHHHGLMFAWGVDGVSFWAEAKDCGLEVHKAWEELGVESRLGAEQAVLRERLLWETPDGKVLLEERRRLTIPAVAKGRPRMLIWQADFTCGKGATAARTIAGSEYYGLGMRLIRPMDKGGRHFNAAGGVGVAGTNGKRAAWTAYTAEVKPGQKVTVAIFSHPANPRHPCEWFTMGEKDAFAYLSGTLGVGTEPLKLEPAATLSVRFAVAVFEGAPNAKRVDSVYQRIPWTPKSVRPGKTSLPPSEKRSTP